MRTGDSSEPRDIFGWLLSAVDVREATVHFAIEGTLTTSMLWQLYDEYRIMAPADAWLLTAMWEEELPQDLVDRTLADPAFWKWFDHGIIDARG